MAKPKRKKASVEGWYWWRLKPTDEWEPRYFKNNEQLDKMVIRGIERSPTRDSNEGMVGDEIEKML